MREKYYIFPLGISEGEHAFSYDLQDTVQWDLVGKEISAINAQATVDVHKRGFQYTLGISLSGMVTLACDRCLQPMEISITGEGNYLVKPAENGESPGLEDEIVWLQGSEAEVDLVPILREMLVLAIPMRNVHETGKCDSEIEKYLKENPTSSQNNQEPIDPRWAALKNIHIN